MFTGLIEETGTILNIDKGLNELYLTIDCNKILEGLKIGDSVAVDGACQTVIEIKAKSFKVYASSQTLSVTTFNNLIKGSIVNLERTLRLGDRLDGHMVSGHIDGLATLKNIRKESETTLLTFETDSKLTSQIVNKGSVSINGVSLTVAEINSYLFTIAVIPHTLNNTNLKYLKINDKVNLETDIIAKYVEKYLLSNDNNNNKATTIDMNLLERNGFL